MAFPLGLTRSLWLGPFLRYLDILLPDRSSLDRRNARALFAGVTVEIVMSR